MAAISTWVREEFVAPEAGSLRETACSKTAIDIESANRQFDRRVERLAAT